MKELFEQITHIEKTGTGRKITYQEAQLIVDSLNGNLQVKHGDDIGSVCYYITLLTIRNISKPKQKENLAEMAAIGVGSELDDVGQRLGIQRKNGATDADYRTKLINYIYR